MTTRCNTQKEALSQAKQRANAEGRPVYVEDRDGVYHIYTCDEERGRANEEDVTEVYPDPPSTAGGWPID